MAEAAPASRPMWLFYHLQGEKGESASHPNVCRLTPAVAGRVTLADVQASFALLSTGSFHFRFQTVTAEKQIVFLDRLHAGDEVPLVNGNVISRVLRLDDLKCASRNAVALQPRLVPRTVVTPTADAAPTAAAPAAVAATAPPRISAPATAVSPPGDGVALSPHTIAAMRPVKPTPPIEEEVVVPDHVDADLADKSDLVKMLVSKRRNEEKRRQADRLAEIAARDAAAKADHDERDSLKATVGQRVKEWGEEATGVKKGIRVLLSSLQAILWPDAKWEVVPMAKLIEPKRVRLAYMKAVAIVHPDKHNTSDAAQKYIASSVFFYLEQAYREFSEKEM